MSDFRDMARDPKHKRQFEKLLYLAAVRGDDDLVAERLSWGIDPNCVSVRGSTPLIANIRGSSPSAATVKALLAAGADAEQTDGAGLGPLDYARRKLLRLQAHPPRRVRSPSLDENGQLQLGPEEQAELDKLPRPTLPRRCPGFHAHVLEGTPSSRPPRLQRSRASGNDRGNSGSSMRAITMRWSSTAWIIQGRLPTV